MNFRAPPASTRCIRSSFPPVALSAVFGRFRTPSRRIATLDRGRAAVSACCDRIRGENYPSRHSRS
nr:unnamed protein product [Callosobruchus chinensis]